MPLGNESNHTMDGLTVRGGLALANNNGQIASVEYDRFASMARVAVLQRGQGFLAETSPRGAGAFSSTIAITQVLYGMPVGLLAGDIVSNLSIAIQVAGNTVTLAKLGLYSKIGTLLASSAESGASFASTGMKTLAMTTPYTVVTDDLYYTAFLAVSAVTMPTPIRTAGNAIASNNAGVGSGFPFQVVQTAQTDLPATATLVTSGSGISYWIGVS